MSSDNHLSALTLRAYRAGRLDPAAALAASDHLVACPSCRDLLALTDGGLSYEELAAAADGTLDLSGRLADDPVAAAELADLQAFKREMASQAGRVYGPKSGNESEATRRRVVTPPASVWRTGVWPLLAVAAAVILLAGGWQILHSFRPFVQGGDLLVDRSGARADLTGLPADLRAAVERTLGSGHPRPVLIPDATLHPPGTTLAGPTASPASAFRVLAPVGVVTRDARPTLLWAAYPNAARYLVTLAKFDGTEDQVSPELPATQTSWTVPEPLTPGAIYHWQVEAISASGDTLAKAPAPPLPEARFRVISDQQRDELTNVEAHYGRFPLVMALAYAQAGLTDEANGQWAELERQHPGSALAQQLRGEAAGQSPSPTNTNGAQ